MYKMGPFIGICTNFADMGSFRPANRCGLRMDKNRKSMKIHKILSAIALCVTLGTAVATAQGGSALPSDSKIAAGTFPNGMNWYVVSNPAEKGFADFALVYRHAADARDYVDVSRRILSDQGRIQGRSLQKFLTSNAIAPTRTGYAECTDDAVTFRFEDVMLQRSPALADSLLLAVFGIVDELSANAVTTKDSLHFPLENMAVIVSGDVNSKDMVSKMGIFSLMTPKNSVLRDSSAVSSSTLESDVPRARVVADTLVGGVCRLSTSFYFPRIPRELMPMMQFAVVDKMSETFSFIAESRLRDALNAARLPFAGVESWHISSADVSGSESISLSFNVLQEDADAAMKCFGEVLGSLDRGEMNTDDIVLSSQQYGEKCLETSAHSVKNHEYVRLCSASFLYNVPLSTGAQLCEFCQSRVLPDTLQLRLMRTFSEALLSPDDSCEAFCAGWNDGKTVRGRAVDLRDTLLLPGPSSKKSKVRTEKELMSDGTMWTFRNGLNVYYKRVPGAQRLYWALNVDRGYASAEGLIPGEAAFLPELLKCRSISGIDNRSLRDIMTATGITADADISLYSTTLKGTATPRSLNLVLQGLVGMFRESKADTAAVSELMRAASVQRKLATGGRNARLAGIDSLICAENPYSDVLVYDNLSPETAAKADRLFAGVFSDLGNGFLVLCGDVEPSELLKSLVWYAEEFPIGKGTEKRPRVRFQPVSGQSTSFRNGQKESIDVLLSAALPMNAANLCTSRLAVHLLKEHLQDALVGTGFYIDVISSFLLYPQERFSVLVSLDRIPEIGFAYGSLSDTEILHALSCVRAALSDAVDVEWPEAVLNAYKSRLCNEQDAVVKSAEYWRDALVTRYADGRDFSTKINERMNSVTADHVRDVMKRIVEGSRVEYVVMK